MIALMNGMTPRRRSHTSVRRSFIGKISIEMERWRYGNMERWKDGSKEIWKYGAKKRWKGSLGKKRKMEKRWSE